MNMDYEHYLESITTFITEYQQLVDCHLVDFFTKNLWDLCLPEPLKAELERANINNVMWNSIQNVEYTELNKFINSTKSLSLQNCPNIIDSETLLEELSEYTNSTSTTEKHFQSHTNTNFMNNKKSYEVEVLGNFVGKVAQSLSGLVIDSGAGKAYLSTYISENYRLPVLAIDSSNVCQKGAICRQEKMKKGNHQSSQLIRYVVKEIQDNTDYLTIVNSQFPGWNIKQNLILTGLHTCGSLVHSVMKAFLNVPEMKFLCVVPCCYHLINEHLDICKLSRNARMLAQQSIERNMSRKDHISVSLFYRAILQILLHSMKLNNVRVGRGGPLNDFPTYARWALLKIGLDVEEIPSITALQQLYDNYKSSKWKIETFQTLRIYLASVLEAAIILDNIIFIRQNCEQSVKSAVLCLFDPVLSPRRYAIVAKR